MTKWFKNTQLLAMHDAVDFHCCIFHVNVLRLCVVLIHLRLLFLFHELLRFLQ